jgi:hypothetical protein
MQEAVPTPCGRVRLCHVYDLPYVRFPGDFVRPDVNGKLWCWQPATEWSPNLVLYEWGAIAAHLFSQGLATHRISGLYMEFENVANPNNTVAIPTFDRGPNSGITYYAGLSANPIRDYQRIQLSSAIVSSTGPNYPRGNRINFFAQSQGVVGVFGRPFSDANNSKVFGAALVAMVSEADLTQDLVMSRFYFDVTQQQLKLATSQVGIDWELTFQ